MDLTLDGQCPMTSRPIEEGSTYVRVGPAFFAGTEQNRITETNGDNPDRLFKDVPRDPVTPGQPFDGSVKNRPPSDLPVTVHRAQKNRITGQVGDALKLALTPSRKRQANASCIMASRTLNVPRSPLLLLPARPAGIRLSGDRLDRAASTRTSGR